MFEIRKAAPEDMPLLVDLIRALAREEGREGDARVTASQLAEDCTGNAPAFEAWIAFVGEEAVGFTLLTWLYSGWQGRRTLYVEDLFILPDHRELSYGSRLFRHVAQMALAKDIKVAWETNRDNRAHRAYYTSQGAMDRPDKVGYFIGGADLERMAARMLTL